MHTFTYALLPHGGDFVEGHTVQEACALNDPMKVSAGKTKVDFESFVTFDNEQVEIDAVKKSEDGNYIVLRFHEFAGSSQNVTVKPGFGYSCWMEGDLRERPLTEAVTTGEMKLHLHPYEIKTILISL